MRLTLIPAIPPICEAFRHPRSEPSPMELPDNSLTPDRTHDDTLTPEVA